MRPEIRANALALSSRRARLVVAFIARHLLARSALYGRLYGRSLGMPTTVHVLEDVLSWACERMVLCNSSVMKRQMHWVCLNVC